MNTLHTNIMQISVNPPSLSNVQLEILKAFSHHLSERDLIEFRKALALFFAQRLMEQADAVWEAKNWDNETCVKGH